VVKYNQRIVSKAKEYLSPLTSVALERKVWRVNNDGVKRTMLAKDVLMHVFVETHHRGEIIAMLWQMDIPPPDMNWLSAMKKTDPVWHMNHPAVLDCLILSRSFCRASIVLGISVWAQSRHICWSDNGYAKYLSLSGMSFLHITHFFILYGSVFLIIKLL
jgi:hypothetical protein